MPPPPETPEEPDGPEPPEEPETPLYGPVEVGRLLGVKPQVVINWIREGRAVPHGVDAIGRNRFTPADVAALRASLGTRRDRPRPPGPPA